MEKNRQKDLERIASEVRKDIVRMVGVARSGPVEFPLMIADLLVFLYWDEMLLLADSPKREDRDRFVLGAEEGVPALYSVLARRGYYSREELWHYRRLGALLQAFPDFRRTPGVDAPPVTVGTGLSIASGLAEALKKEESSPRVFCMVKNEDCTGDDFLLEAERCVCKKLNNIVLMAVSSAEETNEGNLTSESAEKLLKERGWAVSEADVNDFGSLEKAFQLSTDETLAHAPKAIFAHVKTGKGMLLANGDPFRDKKNFNTETMDLVLEELEGKSNG